MKITTYPQPETKSCPFCSETIQAAAIKCRFCGEFLNSPKAKALQGNSQADYCPSEEEPNDNKILFACSPSLLGILPQIFKTLILLSLVALIIKLPAENF